MLAGWPATLQGALEAEEPLFQYKCLQTTHFAKKEKKKKKGFCAVSGKILSLISFPNTSNHLQTTQILLFSLQSSRQCFCTQSSTPQFHTLDLRFKGVDVAFQLQSTPFFFIAFPCSILLNNMLLSLILACSCFLQHVFIVFIACFLAYAMIYRFEVVGLAFLGQDMSSLNIYAQIHMLLGSLPCFCLDLHVQRLYLYPCPQIYVYMCFVPCLCAYIYVGCYFMCFYSPSIF